jgi:shikimate kinase
VPRNLVLVGFMGSGKTAVGREVAAMLALPFVDLDDVIVDRAGASIVQIFQRGGEPEFRRRESAALTQVLRRRGQVIAPGGGALISDRSWRRMRDDNLVIYLSASPTALLRRIRRREELRTGQGRRPRNIRPLADVDPDAPRWPAAARRRVLGLLRQRLPRYRDAMYTVDTTGRRIGAVARDVAQLARRAGVDGGRSRA